MKSSKNHQPKKPSKHFPLFPHASGRWAKKVRGKFVYLGKIADDPKGQAALAKWIEQKDDLLAGRKPRLKDSPLTIADLCNRFLTSKVNRLQNGEISPATFADWKETTDRIVRVLGKTRSVEDVTASDFAELRADIAKTRNPESVGNEINRIRSVFKHAWDNRLIPTPVTFGSEFGRPSRRVLRKVRNSRPQKFFEAGEIRAMIDAARVQLRAMLLLALNGGLGNSDVARLPLDALDLEGGWLIYPRAKTGLGRRIPLWPEATAALKAWLQVRPKPHDERHEDLVFITTHRTPWAKDLIELDIRGVETDKAKWDTLHKRCRKSADNPISKEFRKLLNKLGIKRRGVSFYALRHVFETIGGESRDQVAVNAIMGHADESMAAADRERISDERLIAVTDQVRRWLFGEKPAADRTTEADEPQMPPATVSEAE